MRQGDERLPRPDRLAGEVLARGGPALHGAPRPLERVGRADGRILVQREGDAALQGGARGRNALRTHTSQVFQVCIPPMEDVRGEEGGDGAQPRHLVQLVVAQDLGVDEHGADGAPLFCAKAGEGAQQDARRAVSVAVGKQLRAARGGKAAGFIYLRGGHLLRAHASALIRLAQERRLQLRRSVQKDLHAADAKTRRGAKEPARLVVAVGRGEGDDVGQGRRFCKQAAVEGEHLAGEKALLRRGHAVGEVCALRRLKGASDGLERGHGYPLCCRKVCLFLRDTHVRGQSQKAQGGGVEHPGMSARMLDMDGARGVERPLFGQRLCVLHGDKLALPQPLFAGERLGGGKKVLCRAACAAVHLQQRERIGKDVRVRVGEGRQHARPAQVHPPVIGRPRGHEKFALHSKARSARKGERAVFKQDLHIQRIARLREIKRIIRAIRVLCGIIPLILPRQVPDGGKVESYIFFLNFRNRCLEHLHIVFHTSPLPFENILLLLHSCEV